MAGRRASPLAVDAGESNSVEVGDEDDSKSIRSPLVLAPSLWRLFKNELKREGELERFIAPEMPGERRGGASQPDAALQRLRSLSTTAYNSIRLYTLTYERRSKLMHFTVYT